jgi:hypothetical protein
MRIAYYALREVKPETVFLRETVSNFVYINTYRGRGVVKLVHCAFKGCLIEDLGLRRLKVSQKFVLLLLFLGVLMITFLMGCQSSWLVTTTPDLKPAQTQVIPRETITTSYYQTKAAQFLVQATAGSTGGSSSNEAFPYAPCVISALVVAGGVGIFSRSRRLISGSSRTEKRLE